MTLRQAALWYAEHNIPVFPCRPRGKEPLCEHGFKDATTSRQQIEEWWAQTPQANIGIPCGAQSGWLLFDVDPRNGGDDTLDSLISKYGRWPNTAEADTGGGGRHVLFRHVDGLKCGEIAPGCDLKTTGGYLIAAPSIHPSGKPYQWDGVEGAASCLKLCDPPGWLLRLARNGKPASANNGQPAEEIREGDRHKTLVSFAGKLRRAGCNSDEILSALLDFNKRKCKPPKKEADVRKVADDIGQRYEPCGDPDAPRTFEALADARYILRVPGVATEIEVDRLRRDRNELVGELGVRCTLPGARTYEGVLSIADFNLSSARARTDRAKLLATRSQAADIDWQGLLEEFVQRVLAAERNGQPAIDLRDLPEPQLEEIQVKGFTFPRSHPTIIFGDGGAAKSYTALYLAGRLAQAGMTIALFDWELSGEDHRYRLRLLFGSDMPRILYVRCERPLVAEADRLRRIVRESGIDYAIYDSVAFACDGPPEAAEVAGRYFRAVRQIGAGSTHIAHVSKALDSDKKPFGSTFWHNGARSTWFCKAAEAQGNESTLEIAFFNRKANLGPIKPPLGFTVTFSPERTTFRHSDPGDTPDLALKMSVRQRMFHALQQGPATPDEVAADTDADLKTVTRTARRYKTIFTVLKDGRLALLQRSAS